jgi:hypothetical protein
LFKLKIETGNAAFEEEPAEEIIRILESQVIGQLAKGYESGTLRDLNGNECGAWELSE